MAKDMVQAFKVQGGRRNRSIKQPSSQMNDSTSIPSNHHIQLTSRPNNHHNQSTNRPSNHHNQSTSRPSNHHNQSTSRPSNHHNQSTSRPSNHHNQSISRPSNHHNQSTSRPSNHHNQSINQIDRLIRPHFRKLRRNPPKIHIEDVTIFCSPPAGTNINDALVSGLSYLEEHEEKTGSGGDTRTSMIIFLTDGQPTTGITSNPQIISNAKQANTCK